MSDDKAVQSLIGLCCEIGFDQVDAEVETWIEMGEFDEQVKERARKLGWIPPDTPYSELDRPLF